MVFTTFCSAAIPADQQNLITDLQERLQAANARISVLESKFGQYSSVVSSLLKDERRETVDLAKKERHMVRIAKSVGIDVGQHKDNGMAGGHIHGMRLHDLQRLLAPRGPAAATKDVKDLGSAAPSRCESAARLAFTHGYHQGLSSRAHATVESSEANAILAPSEVNATMESSESSESEPKKQTKAERCLARNVWRQEREARESSQKAKETGNVCKNGMQGYPGRLCTRQNFMSFAGAPQSYCKKMAMLRKGAGGYDEIPGLKDPYGLCTGDEVTGYNLENSKSRRKSVKASGVSMGAGFKYQGPNLKDTCMPSFDLLKEWEQDPAGVEVAKFLKGKQYDKKTAYDVEWQSSITCTGSCQDAKSLKCRCHDGSQAEYFTQRRNREDLASSMHNLNQIIIMLLDLLGQSEIPAEGCPWPELDWDPAKKHEIKAALPKCREPNANKWSPARDAILYDKVRCDVGLEPLITACARRSGSGTLGESAKFGSLTSSVKGAEDLKSKAPARKDMADGGVCRVNNECKSGVCVGNMNGLKDGRCGQRANPMNSAAKVASLGGKAFHSIAKKLAINLVNKLFGVLPIDRMPKQCARENADEEFPSDAAWELCKANCQTKYPLRKPLQAALKPALLKIVNAMFKSGNSKNPLKNPILQAFFKHFIPALRKAIPVIAVHAVGIPRESRFCMEVPWIKAPAFIQEIASIVNNGNSPSQNIVWAHEVALQTDSEKEKKMSRDRANEEPSRDPYMTLYMIRCKIVPSLSMYQLYHSCINCTVQQGRVRVVWRPSQLQQTKIWMERYHAVSICHMW